MLTAARKRRRGPGKEHALAMRWRYTRSNAQRYASHIESKSTKIVVRDGDEPNIVEWWYIPIAGESEKMAKR